MLCSLKDPGRSKRSIVVFAVDDVGVAVDDVVVDDVVAVDVVVAVGVAAVVVETVLLKQSVVT